MGDILPYLGVAQSWEETDPAAKKIPVEDYCGLTAEDAARKLKDTGLCASFSGTGDLVTGQLPGPGQTVPGGSQVLLYLGENPEERTVKMPDFSGMNRAQAAQTAGALGLYVLVTGNTGLSASVVATAQNIPPETGVTPGTTVTLTFTDTAARD